MANVFEHFACHTNLPIRLEAVKDHLLETGMIDEIVRVPVPVDGYIVIGGYHKYRDLQTGKRVALIGYPEDASEGMRRVVCVKEMLHIVDPHEATAPTRAKVDQLIDGLLMSGAANLIGLPAYFDKRGLLRALTILFPRDAIDEHRPLYKKDESYLKEIAKKAILPVSFVELALRDDWSDLLDSI
jgi:hypothetical protein